MSSLVIELQTLAVDSTTDISELLRKALMVASKLGVDDISEWLKNEMNGYESVDDLPEYRILPGSLILYDNYTGANYPIILKADYYDLARTHRFIDSCGRILSLVSGETKNVRLELPHFLETELHRICKMSNSQRILREFNTDSLNDILNKVRNIILEWSLDLEKRGIIGDGMAFAPDEKSKAASVSQITIQNFQGVLGDVNNGSVQMQNTQNIVQNDFNSLADFLRKQGISDNDISELKSAIDNDEKPSSDGKFGERTAAWLGKMVPMAASGAINTATNIASSVLTNAICKYYGLS